MTTLTSIGSTYRIMETEETDFDVRQLPWFDCLEILLHDYQPAERQDKDLVTWTTPEIVNALIAHFGDDRISGQHVFEAMLALDYHYTSRGSLQLEWMLKRK